MPRPACSSLDRVLGGPEGLPRVKLSHEASQLTSVAVETAVKLAGLAQSNRTPSNTGRLQDDLKRESQRVRRKILVSAKLARLALARRKSSQRAMSACIKREARARRQLTPSKFLLETSYGKTSRNHRRNRREGEMTMKAAGFTGGACLKEIEVLMKGMNLGGATITHMGGGGEDEGQIRNIQSNQQG